MWVLKTKGFDKGNIFGEKAIRHKVSIHYYPLNHYFEKGTYYFTAVGIVEGQESNIKSFFNDLRKDTKNSKIKRYVATKRYVVSLEVSNNFFVCVTAQRNSIELNKYVRLYYNLKIIHINPAIIDSKGFETWNIALQKREDIEELIEIGEMKYNAEILFFKEMRLKNIGILSVLPEVTEKQKQAFLLAYGKGYYDYPRRIELEKLASLMKISLSTYHAHLRKAEKSFLGFIARKYF